MINLDRKDQSPPYKKFYNLYDSCLKNNQKNIQVIGICSYNNDTNEVDARFVNLKYILGDKWIFFTNYNSPKSIQFSKHDQISVILYWDSINIQIRLKAKIKKTSVQFSDKHYHSRSDKKNALAYSSNQSSPIESYQEVKDKFFNTLLNKKSYKKRPSYWGGYSFTPYSIEFWEGHEHRLNNREIFTKNKDLWKSLNLQP